MQEIVVLEKNEGKNVVSERCVVDILRCNVLRLSVPIRNKLKRKYKSMLNDIQQSCDYVVGTNPVFLPFCQKNTKTFMHFYPTECVAYITQCVKAEELAFLANYPTKCFLETVCRLGKRFPYVTVYTNNEQKMNETAMAMRKQTGLPLRVKSADGPYSEKYILRTDTDFSVVNIRAGTEYIDVKLSFSGRLEPFLSLPLYEMLCIPNLADEVRRLLKTGEIKIVGTISK